MTTPTTPYLTSVAETPKRFLLIQGAPGTFKTRAIRKTAPNPFWGDFDSALTAFPGEPIPSVPFHDTAWCLSNLKQYGTNVRDIFKNWLEKEAPKFEPEQTFVLDSWTRMQDVFDVETWRTPILTRKGEVDDFAPWGLKIDYAQSIMTTLLSLRCNVVVICHESALRDAKGNLTSGFLPMMQGKFCDKMASYPTEYVRAKWYKLPTNEVIPVWQVKADTQFSPKVRVKDINKLNYVDPEKLHIRADWAELLK